MKVCEIESAVAVLEDAIRQKKAEMRHAKAQSPGLISAMPGLLSGLWSKAGGPLSWGKGLMTNMQQDLHDNPWSMVRKVAAVSFAAGIALSSGRKKSDRGKA